jgi:hypothetical protein
MGRGAGLAGALGLAVAATACVTPPPADAGDDAEIYTDDADDVEEQLLFTCTPFVGAPHESIRVYLIDPDGQAKAGAAGGAAVLIEMSHVEDGVRGRCKAEAATGGGAQEKAAGSRYACAAANGSIKLSWPASAAADGAPKTADVDVHEQWLLGTRTYRATCERER